MADRRLPPHTHPWHTWLCRCRAGPASAALCDGAAPAAGRGRSRLGRRAGLHAQAAREGRARRGGGSGGGAGWRERERAGAWQRALGIASACRTRTAGRRLAATVLRPPPRPPRARLSCAMRAAAAPSPDTRLTAFVIASERGAWAQWLLAQGSTTCVCVERGAQLGRGFGRRAARKLWRGRARAPPRTPNGAFATNAHPPPKSVPCHPPPIPHTSPPSPAPAAAARGSPARPAAPWPAGARRSWGAAPCPLAAPCQEPACRQRSRRPPQTGPA